MRFNQPMKYKEICEEIGDELLKAEGSKRDYQLKRWQLDYEIIHENTYYTIIRELTPDEKEFMREEATTRKRMYYRIIKDHPQFKIDYKNCHGAGVYIIQNKKYIYIGQSNNFYNRFYMHFKGYFDKEMHFNIKTILDNDGTFEVLELEDDLNKRLAAEVKWIQYYKNNSDKTVVNGNNGEVHGRCGINKHKNKGLYRYIKVSKQNYEKAKKVLKANGIDILGKGEGED